jgi:hypothetical protein
MAQVKALLDREGDHGQGFDHVERWLMLRSPYFREELIEGVQVFPEGPLIFKGPNPYPMEEMAALLRLDFKTGKDLLLRMAREGKNPLAAAALLEHSLRPEGKELAGLKEELRKGLMQVVEDRKALPPIRECALGALAKDAWPGQEKWLEGLFADPTLREVRIESKVFTPITAILKDSDRWLPLPIRLVKDPRRDVHEAAVVILGDLLQRPGDPPVPEAALRALLPWLKNPSWADDQWSLRLYVVRALVDMKMPECVPDLLRMMETEQDESVVGSVADALARHSDPRAIPLLRKRLARIRDYSARSSIVNALLACGGYALHKQVDAIAGKRIGDPEPSPPPTGAFSPPEAEGSLLYRALLEQPPKPALAQAVLDRADRDEQAGAGISQEMFRALLQWDHAPGHRWLIQRLIRHGLRTGEYPWPTTQPVETDSNFLPKPISRFGLELRNLLACADLLQKDAPADLAQLRSMGGSKGALGAVLLGDSHAAARILREGDPRTVSALLATAALVRMPLPLERVARQLDSKEPPVARAAEAYLRAEGSLAAQALFMAHRPGQSVVFGAKSPELSAPFRDPADNEVYPPPEEEWTLRRSSAHSDRITVRRWADRAEIIHATGGAFPEAPVPRPLTARELSQLQAFLAENRIDELADFSPQDVHISGGTAVTYEHRKPLWGRRVSMDNVQFIAPFSVYDRLVKHFEKLALPPGPATTRPASGPARESADKAEDGRTAP